jgi:ankyrin repeat protein
VGQKWKLKMSIYSLLFIWHVKKGTKNKMSFFIRGANIMALDNRYWTASHYASYNGHPKAVNFLLKFEADFDKLYRIKNS